jgi:predicted AAA+ superfamily ATPase
MREDILTDPIEMGIIAETAVYKHVFTHYSRLAANIGYLRGQSRDNEIDIAVEHPRDRILIEVKYREHYEMNDKSLIVTEARKAGESYLITKREDDFGPLQACPSVYRIPLFAYLYLLGRVERERYFL